MRMMSAPDHRGPPSLQTRLQAGSRRLPQLVAGPVALVAIVLCGLLVPVPQFASADDAKRPGMMPIARDTPLTEKHVYPPGVALGGFDGAYTEGTVYKPSAVAGSRVAFWASEPGLLRSFNYPIDEFVYVLEGDVVTIDADGTRREFHPGDTFIIPKGWVGTWDMKTPFKKIIVNL